MIKARTGPKSLLEGYGLRSKKSFGQHFLVDDRLAERIAELATTPPGGTVIEVGAGLGALTRWLLRRAARVVAVERDRELVPILRRELSPEQASGTSVRGARAGATPPRSSVNDLPRIVDGHLVILEADAKRIDVAALVAGGPPPRVLAGNLPYQLSGPLLEMATRSVDCVDRVVFLLQLEVVQRVTASAGSASYGALSVFVQSAFEAERAFVVRRGAFYPQPKVDSAVVVLKPRSRPIAKETDAFRTLVRSAFSQRRKTLKNAWKGILGRSPAQIADAAARAGVDLSARGETLAVQKFARMAEELGA